MKTMAKLFIFFGLLFTGINVWAVVQVPEDCIGKISPCLVRADDRSAYIFNIQNYKISLLKGSIVKLTHEKGHLNINIIVGRVDIQESNAGELSVAVNTVLVDSKRVFVSRFKNKLQVFTINGFYLTDYHLDAQNNDLPLREKSIFLSKKELVEFVSHYFSSVSEFKLFLSGIESAWVAEFKRQNENQTKALLRSIASEEKQVELRIQRENQKKAELKKVRNDFFFRTFQR